MTDGPAGSFSVERRHRGRQVGVIAATATLAASASQKAETCTSGQAGHRSPARRRPQARQRSQHGPPGMTSTTTTASTPPPAMPTRTTMATVAPNGDDDSEQECTRTRQTSTPLSPRERHALPRALLFRTHASRCQPRPASFSGVDAATRSLLHVHLNTKGGQDGEAGRVPVRCRSCAAHFGRVRARRTAGERACRASGSNA